MRFLTIFEIEKHIIDKNKPSQSHLSTFYFLHAVTTENTHNRAARKWFCDESAGIQCRRKAVMKSAKTWYEGFMSPVKKGSVEKLIKGDLSRRFVEFAYNLSARCWLFLRSSYCLFHKIKTAGHQKLHIGLSEKYCRRGERPALNLR